MTDYAKPTWDLLHALDSEVAIEVFVFHLFSSLAV